MGNAGSGTRPSKPSSPKDDKSFTFDKKSNLRSKDLSHGSHDEDGPLYTKMAQSGQEEFQVHKRQRSATVSEGPSKHDMPTAKEIPTVFKWEGGGKQAFICGTFSEWKTVPMVKSHGDFVAIVDLPEGEHEYRFCVDGEMKCDPAIKQKESEDGAKTNVISVKDSDFEVFKALERDSGTATGDMQKEYGQEIPANKPWEKSSGPPILPPHLLQVILNKDTPLSCEPTLLPEPNHVMLNHLYALSIKDGVMVLSATHRYRKKYVTTLLYKPI